MIEERKPIVGEIRIIGTGEVQNSRVQVMTADGWVNIKGVVTATINLDAEEHWVTAFLQVRRVTVDVVAADPTQIEVDPTPASFQEIMARLNRHD